MAEKNAETSVDAQKKEAKDAGQSKSSKLTTNQKIMIGGFAGTAVAVAVAAAVIVSALNKETPPETSGGSLVVNEANLAEIDKELDAIVDDGMFMTDMNVDWTFPDGGSVSTDAYVGNMANNNYPFYFELVDSGSGEIVYTSDVVPPGYSLKEIKLDKDLDAGVYPMVCNYSLVNDESGEVVSSVGVAVTVHILN